MSKCGRCRGKGWHQPIRGVGQVDCAECKGTGEKIRKSTLRGSSHTIPGPYGQCKFCPARAVEAHHVAPKNSIKAILDESLWDDALTDPRDGVPVCRPCHDRVERNLTLRVEPHQLHPEFWSFIRDYDIFAAVPRHLAERWAA